MRKVFKTTLQPKENLIDLAPLVDVVFLLLIFFFVTSEILPLKSLPLKVPDLKVDATPIPTKFLIMVDKYGVIYVGSKKVVTDLAHLPLFLAEQEKKWPEGYVPTLVLSMDEEVSYGVFLKIFSVLQETSREIRFVFEYSSP